MTRPNNPKAVYRALVVLVVALIVFIVWQQLSTEKDAEQAQGTAQTLAEQVAAVCEQGGPAAAELGPACTDAKAIKQNEPTSPADDSGKVREAVTAYCSTGACRGEDGRDANIDQIVARVLPLVPAGEDGQDAEPVDYDRIIQAVLELMPEPEKGDKGDACLPSNSACKGPKGDVGEDGPYVQVLKLDLDSCTGSGTLSDGNAFTVALSGCTPAAPPTGEEPSDSN